MRFGEALAEVRRGRGLSQHGLGLAVGTPQRHISFMETGRSRPTREMIVRLCEALQLRPARRADLFEAAGFVSPYKRRLVDDPAVMAAFAGIQRYVLAPWPYPAFALSRVWDVLAANEPARRLFGLGEIDGKAPPNLFGIMLSPRFRCSVVNWTEVAAVVLARLRRHADEHPGLRESLDAAIADGAFDGVLSSFAAAAEVPAILPLVFRSPDGSAFRMTSLTARLTSAHDEVVSGLEVELCVPVDDESDAILRGARPDIEPAPPADTVDERDGSGV